MHRRIGRALLPLVTVLGVCALLAARAQGQGPSVPAQQTTLPAIDCPKAIVAHPFTRPIGPLLGTAADPAAYALAPNQRAFAVEAEALEAQALAAAHFTIHPVDVTCPGLAAFDWVTKGKVTPIEDQGLICGACWDFAAIAAYETSYAIINGPIIDASEQYALDCATAPGGGPAGSCAGVNIGPWHAGAHAVFNWMETHAEATAAQDPYQGKDNPTCPVVAGAPYHALAWDWVGTPPTSATAVPIASVADIKAAVCQHGGVVSSVNATNWNKYSCGVWTETGVTGFNHSVLIVGWDNAHHAWLVKNSWGTSFGQNGFIWVDWSSDNIGSAAVWVDAASTKIPPISVTVITSLMGKHKLLVAPDHK